MKFSPDLKVGDPASRATECLVYPVVQNEAREPEVDELPNLSQKRLDDFSADRGETQLHYEGNFEAGKLVLLGCGEKNALEPADLTELAGKAVKAAESQNVEEATVVHPLKIDLDREEAADKFTTGLCLAGYEFDRFKSDADEDSDDKSEEDEEAEKELEKLTLLLADGRSKPTVTRGHGRGKKLAAAVTLSRDLGNTPANEMSPADLEEEAREIADSAGQISFEVFDRDRLADEGFNLIRAVGRGSEIPPRLIQLDYCPESTGETVVLAGKGVTFDSGGISLKPSKNMGEMKFDMCGAGIVLGVLAAVDSLELPLRVIGLIPAVENMPDSRSTRPGDVISGYGDKSVEILNTDAEGRLILADTLSYAAEQFGERADFLVDYATLTGSCIVALGHAGAGLMGNDEELCDQLLEAGKETDERLWRLPLWEEFEEKLESETADIKNIGGRAGTSIAGTFLREFVDEDKFESWAHLDVAGTAWGMKEKSYRPKGGTGFGVRLTVELLRNRYNI